MGLKSSIVAAYGITCFRARQRPASPGITSRANATASRWTKSPRGSSFTSIPSEGLVGISRIRPSSDHGRSARATRSMDAQPCPAPGTSRCTFRMTAWWCTRHRAIRPRSCRDSRRFSAHSPGSGRHRKNGLPGTRRTLRCCDPHSSMPTNGSIRPSAGVFEAASTTGSPWLALGRLKVTHESFFPHSSKESFFGFVLRQVEHGDFQ